MYFKQASFFRVKPEAFPDNDTLATKLQTAAFAPPQGLDWYGEGWTQPYSFSDGLVFPAEDTVLIALKREEKVLPAPVIREAVGKKAAEIAKAEKRNIGLRERQEIKKQIIEDLLPRALTRSRHTHALFYRPHNLLIINQASAAKAEYLLCKLREALGGLEAQPLQTAETPASLMTRWLLDGQADGGFQTDSSVKLRGNGDVAATANIRNQDLGAEEVVCHARNGKTVNEMGLVWREQTALALTADFALKNICYLDTVLEQADNSAEDAYGLAQSSQLIVANLLNEITEELAAHLGGWA